MGMVRWIVGGLIGAAAGVIIWVLVGYFAHYEVGWIAWAVGFLAGLGVRYAAYLGGEDASVGKGILAVLIAIAAIFTAKLLVFTLLVGWSDRAPLRELADHIRFDQEGMIAHTADGIVKQMTARGESVAWPAGVTPGKASRQADYPPEIWQQAETAWSQLSPDQQKEQERMWISFAMVVSQAARRPQFDDTFHPLDLLWFGLAIVTAYKVGVGTYGSGD